MKWLLLFCFISLQLIQNYPSRSTDTNGTQLRHTIPHFFNLYSEPDFGSAVIGRLPPQSLIVMPVSTDGWSQVSTAIGTGYINIYISPNYDRMNNYLGRLGHNVAVFYKNLDTGLTFIHNPERVLFAASLSKLTHAFYTYQMAERGYIDIYQNFTFRAADQWGGTGTLQFQPHGTVLTMRELLGLSIIESDNAAFRMLVRYTSANVNYTFHDFVREKGRVQRFIRDIYAQNTSVVDMGNWMYLIWHYINEESQFGHYFLHDLKNTAQTSHPHFTRWPGSFGVGGEVNVRMIESDYEMARKYGWTTGAFHDAAIVFADSPYILVIITNMDRGAHALFEDVSLFVQDFNRRTFAQVSGNNE